MSHLLDIRNIVKRSLEVARPLRPIEDVVPYNFSLIAKAFADPDANEESLSLIQNTIDEEAVRFSRTVVNRLTFLRMTLVPLMSRIRGRIETSFDKQTLTQPEIVQANLPALFQHPQYMMMVAEQANQSSEKHERLLVDYPEMSEEEILDFLKTGNQSVDDAIVEMAVDNHPRDWVSMIYKSYFVQKNPFEFGKEATSMELEIYAICHLILSAMVARRWKSSVDTKASSVYEKSLLEDMQNAAARLNGRYQQFDTEIRRGQIVIAYDPDIKRHIVDSDNYNAYISEGGDLDTLLYCIKRKLPTYKGAILASYATLKEKAVGEWAAMVEDRKRNYNAIAVQNFQEIFGIELNKLLEKDIRFMTREPKAPDEPILPEERREIVARAFKHFAERIQNEEMHIALQKVILDDILNIRGFNEFYSEVTEKSTSAEDARIEAGRSVIDELIDAVIAAGMTPAKE